MKKYGIQGFEITILEDNIYNIEDLKKREQYWIAYYNTYIDNGGYNLTAGGDSVPKPVKKLQDNEISEIKNLLKNSKLTENEIAKKFNVSLYAVSDINRGKSWYESDLEYPLREYQFI